MSCLALFCVVTSTCIDLSLNNFWRAGTWSGDTGFDPLTISGFLDVCTLYSSIHDNTLTLTATSTSCKHADDGLLDFDVADKKCEKQLEIYYNISCCKCSHLLF